MTPDETWENQKDDVFNVVADIEVPSEQIRYAFLAGYCAATGATLVVDDPDPGPPCHYCGRLPADYDSACTPTPPPPALWRR